MILGGIIPRLVGITSPLGEGEGEEEGDTDLQGELVSITVSLCVYENATDLPAVLHNAIIEIFLLLVNTQRGREYRDGYSNN